MVTYSDLFYYSQFFPKCKYFCLPNRGEYGKI